MLAHEILKYFHPLALRCPKIAELFSKVADPGLFRAIQEGDEPINGIARKNGTARWNKWYFAIKLATEPYPKQRLIALDVDPQEMICAFAYYGQMDNLTWCIQNFGIGRESPVVGAVICGQCDGYMSESQARELLIKLNEKYVISDCVFDSKFCIYARQIKRELMNTFNPDAKHFSNCRGAFIIKSALINKQFCEHLELIHPGIIYGLYYNPNLSQRTINIPETLYSLGLVAASDIKSAQKLLEYGHYDMVLDYIHYIEEMCPAQSASVQAQIYKKTGGRGPTEAVPTSWIMDLYQDFFVSDKHSEPTDQNSRASLTEQSSFKVRLMDGFYNIPITICEQMDSLKIMLDKSLFGQTGMSFECLEVPYLPIMKQEMDFIVLYLQNEKDGPPDDMLWSKIIGLPDYPSRIVLEWFETNNGPCDRFLYKIGQNANIIDKYLRNASVNVLNPVDYEKIFGFNPFQISSAKSDLIDILFTLYIAAEFVGVMHLVADCAYIISKVIYWSMR
jgi:predicted metal-binding protein